MSIYLLEIISMSISSIIDKVVGTIPTQEKYLCHENVHFILGLCVIGLNYLNDTQLAAPSALKSVFVVKSSLFPSSGIKTNTLNFIAIDTVV